MKKKRVVIPENMGRGIKANTEKSQYEVDLTDYVDGSTVTYTGGKLGVNVPASITSVSTAGAIEGDGSSTNPVKLDFNDSIVKGTDGKYGVAVTGLTCASIDDLPEKPWKKGTTILAKQDGACVRLSALDSIFQKIGVGIIADKTNSFTNEEYNVVVTVSNTGESTNELTNLNIVGPEITPNYTVKNVRVGNSGAEEVERVDDFTYNIRSLRKGGTVNVRFTVVPKANGTYQFTAAVNPNSALDMDLGNNSATLVLSARTKADPTYVPSVDCPLITATELDSNVVLQQLKPFESSENGVTKLVYSTNSFYSCNVFSQRRNLKGLRIRLDGASTVVGYSETHYQSSYVYLVNRDTTTPPSSVNGDYDNYIRGDQNALKNGTAGYTFKDGVLEITADTMSFAFSCRPAGSNCRWQNYSLFAVNPVVKRTITTSEVVGGSVEIKDVWGTAVTNLNNTNPLARQQLVIPTDGSINTDFTFATGSRLVKADNKLIVTVRAGTAASLKYTSIDNYAVTQVRGKTTITEDTITVAADAKSTDSVNTQYIQVIVEE
nr:MAG TPA: CARDB protein [Caudoviricetes sp.]